MSYIKQLFDDIDKTNDETIVEEGNEDTHPGNPASPRFWQNM